MREILEALLTREGYQVRLASSGQEGLDLARSMPFDAAIVDVMMPGHRRHHRARGAAQVRRGPARHHDHGLRLGRDRHRAMKRGAFDYITKPFKNDEVLAC